MGRVWWIALAVGCYQPVPPANARCSLEGECPAGQHCVGDVCRPDGFDDPDAPALADASDVDGPAIDAPPPPPDAPLTPLWGTPTKIPGVNTAFAEEDPSLTPDLLTIVFMSDRNGSDDIFIGTRASTAAAFTVTALAVVNSPTADDSPELSPDGNTLYFASDRTGNFEVYRSVKLGNGGFTAPLVVSELSSPTAGEGDLAVSPDGLTTIIARDNEMFIATRSSPTGTFSTPAIVPALNITPDVAAPSITDGAAAVYFHAGQGRDLYVSHRSGNTFSPPLPITELNTAARDAGPFISPDEHHLAFERAGELFESTR